jgi:hypothetical protein
MSLFWKPKFSLFWFTFYRCFDHLPLTVISLERVRNAFSADVCEWFLVLDWIIHQRVPWEQHIRYIYLPSLQLPIIMWLSHLLTSFSSQRDRYLFPKYRVTHIWAERFRYGYTPCLGIEYFFYYRNYDGDNLTLNLSRENQGRVYLILQGYKTWTVYLGVEYWIKSVWIIDYIGKSVHVVQNIEIGLIF